MAAKKGAVGAIIIHTTPSAGYGWQVVQTSWSGEQFELPDDGAPRSPRRCGRRRSFAKKIVELGGKDLDALRAAAESRSFRPVPLGVTMSVALTIAIGQKESGNVIGVLPGSDPKRAGEAVIYTAHHDHLGVRVGAKAGFRRDLQRRPRQRLRCGRDPRRRGRLRGPRKGARALDVLRVRGGGGAGPSRVGVPREASAGPAGRIAANINVDGIGWFGRTKEIVLIGKGKSSLDADVEALAKMQGRRVEGDQFPDRGTFYRSDQFNFAKIGVPAAYLKKGTDVIGKPPGFGREQEENYEKNDYHQPSDEFKETWDFSGAVEDARLAFWLGCRVADAPAMPRWNKGDEFEAARLKAVGEAGAR